MACLVNAGLVNLKRKGRYAYYSVNKDTIEMLSSEIASLKNPSKEVSVEKKTKRKEEPVSEVSAEKNKKGKKKKKKDKDKSKKKKKD
jgi:DNA-binding transcriptional ArsR family regulator